MQTLSGSYFQCNKDVKLVWRDHGNSFDVFVEYICLLLPPSTSINLLMLTTLLVGFYFVTGKRQHQDFQVDWFSAN